MKILLPQEKPKGLAKIWREVKRPVGKLSRLIDRKLLGMSRAQYEWHESFSTRFYVHDDGRVNLPKLDVDVAIGCNLSCYQCEHLSPYRKGIVPIEKIVHWFETWSKKIRPNHIHLLGGEPFLHPDLAGIVSESRKIWGDVITLSVISNGLLIPHASQKILDALKDTNFHVYISDHSCMDVPREKVVAGCPRLEKNGIPYTIWNSHNDIRILHQLDGGTPMPFQNSPHDAWSKCFAKHCPALANNRLYKCTILPAIIEGVKENALSSSLWKNALTHNGLSPDADVDSIMKYFRTEEVEACCICPNKVIAAETKQMPRLPQTFREAS